MMMAKAKKYYVPPVIVVYEVEKCKLLDGSASSEGMGDDKDNY